MDIYIYIYISTTYIADGYIYTSEVSLTGTIVGGGGGVFAAYVITAI